MTTKYGDEIIGHDIPIISLGLLKELMDVVRFRPVLYSHTCMGGGARWGRQGSHGPADRVGKFSKI